MAQTKRKRRTKHRGNAAGTIEARGRTGRKPTAEEQRKADARQRREDRFMRPPSWKGSFIRAAFAAALLIVLFQIGLGPRLSLGSTILLAILALGIYVPIGYATDRLIYNRRMRKAGRRP